MLKIKLNIKFYFVAYFFMLLFLYYYKVVNYPTWNYFAYLNNSNFDFSLFRFLIVVVLFFFNLKALLKLGNCIRTRSEDLQLKLYKFLLSAVSNDGSPIAALVTGGQGGAGS